MHECVCEGRRWEAVWGLAWGFGGCLENQRWYWCIRRTEVCWYMCACHISGYVFGDMLVVGSVA